MMNTVVGILLLITYVAFAIYAAKGGNLMIGFFVMAVLWAGLGAIAGVTAWSSTAEGVIDINNGIFEQGPELWGSTAAIIIFGSWFGRILVDTGIARTLIRTAVEWGGDKPALTCILLSIVTSLIFTSAYGAGSVVAIGVIIFPILLSLGISTHLASASFLMSVGAGLYLNNGWLKQVGALIPEFDITIPTWKTYGFIAFGIQMLAVVLMILISSRGTAKKHPWAAKSDQGEKKVGALALLTPVIPVCLSVFLNFKPITAILVAVLWALVFTGNLKNMKDIGDMVQKTFHDGVTDVALVFAFLFFLQMFLRSAKVCAPLLAPIMQPVLPSNLLILFVIFGVFSVMALFRGPLTVWGAGAATLAMFQAIGGVFTPMILFPLFMVPATTINGSICPTQSWCLWAIGYTKTDLKQYFKTCLPFALVAALVLEMVAYFMFV
ncbi:citrate transporter [Lacrimispora sp.]|uniref:citrate transporter n=1 Tax=Lacrimispora sp. TaxID=2719234 RepID=UPI0028ADAE5A|nr:citrate transporter [Lacrimispora sp.]